MKNTNKNSTGDHTEHVPVLLQSVLECLQPQAGESYLDVTAGYGGHAAAVGEMTQALARAVLVDRDSHAISVLNDRFNHVPELIHADFLTASRQLKEAGKRFDMILADLGVSSPHFNEASRGFSIQSDGPLDMRMDQRQQVSAETIVNQSSEAELAKLLATYGEEPKSKQIARMIVTNRPIKTTGELAQLVAKAWPGHSKVHPATRTFQALRIAVNDELRLLEQSLPIWLDLLAPGGRLAIISFHSLEDRMVKQAFKDAAGDRYDADFRLITKHPLTASQEEIVFNPRARSAKLRAVAKIKNKEGELNANSGKK